MAHGRKVKQGKLECMLGNLKLGFDTLIFNLGTALECPSRKLGLCMLGKKCYALKAERLYPTCKPYRERQAAYWLGVSTEQLLHDFSKLIDRLRKKPAYLRLNESGDFYNQECVDKAEALARHLRKVYGIKVYTYSARSDMDFSKCEYLSVKGSGHDQGNNGRTIARKAEDLKGWDVYKERGRVYEVCPMNCRNCFKCKEKNNMNVVFPLH